VTLDHPFDPYTYDDRVFCVHVEVRDGVGRTCGRPKDEHPVAQVDESVNQQNDMSTVDKATSS
jgi:hypothetical protein